jgi:DNA-binding CsgD family transcriptional regulator
MSNEEPHSVASSRKDFGLSPLEKQVIAFIVAGFSSEEAMQSLGISGQALRQHLVNIFDKLKVSNRLELVLFALYHRLTGPFPLSPSRQRSAPRTKTQTHLPGG